MIKSYFCFAVASLLLNACTGESAVTRVDFSLPQNVISQELQEIYSYDKLKRMQPQNKHLPKRMTGMQGDDYLFEFELYVKKYLLLEETEIRVKKKNELSSSVEIYSYKLGFFNKKRDKERELLRMKDIEGKLIENPSNKAH